MENTNLSELTNRITLSLETLRPHLQADGGDIEIVEITDDFTIKVRLIGACRTCPRSVFALKGGIKQYLKSEFPQINNVVAVNT